MKTHTFEIPEAEWAESKYRTREWEKRVKITRWEHDYVDKMYRISIQTK
jgi:hypothetical protein